MPMRYNRLGLAQNASSINAMPQDLGYDTTASPDTVHVDFEPIGRRGPCKRGLHLLECAHHLGVGLAAVCGGHGTCGRCRVVPVLGRLSTPTAIEHSTLSNEEIASGIRLACQAIPVTDCVVHVPAESLTATQRIQLEGLQIVAGSDPPVIGREVTVTPPGLQDVRGDTDRVLARLSESAGNACDTVDLEAARAIPGVLRSQEWTIEVTLRGRELIAAGPWPSPTLGLAVDLGTTKIACYLLDLTTGDTLAARGIMNPQIRYGEDVVTRLTHAMSASQGANELAAASITAINNVVVELAGEVNIDPARILEAVIVGNTAMHHLLLGLPIEQLSRAPYVPAVTDALDIKARDVGLRIGKGSYIHLPPNIAGFVGSDHVATILATNVATATGPVLVIDIGTNTEVCLAVDGHLTSVSCASGPAFEGGHIRDGMRASPGAIEHMEIHGDEVRLQVIDDIEPAGICGSGILDALAEMAAHGIVDTTGKLSREHPSVSETERSPEFVLVPASRRDGRQALSVTQGDIRQLQLAKAAIATGIQALLEHARMDASQLDSVIIAGAFGSYIDIRNAMAIGMLPSLPLNRFRQTGNAAGVGAKMALASMSSRAEARELSRQTAYLELATAPGFTNGFVANTRLATFQSGGG